MMSLSRRYTSAADRSLVAKNTRVLYLDRIERLKISQKHQQTPLNPKFAEASNEKGTTECG